MSLKKKGLSYMGLSFLTFTTGGKETRESTTALMSQSNGGCWDNRKKGIRDNRRAEGIMA